MLEDPLDALHIRPKDPDHRIVPWTCPRNGAPLHFELDRSKAPMPVPREILCPGCQEDHWAACQAALGEAEMRANEVRLVYGRGRDW